MTGNAINNPKTRKARRRRALNRNSESQQAEDALYLATQLNQHIMAGANEGIVVRDRDLKILSWNPFMEELTGKSAAETIGKDPLVLFPFLQDAGVAAHFQTGPR